MPWLIRVFQNKHLSELRHRHGLQPLPEDDLASATCVCRIRATNAGTTSSARRRANGSTAAEQEVLILGLRLRYRLSQREVAGLLGIHEGNVSRRTARLRDHCLEQIGEHLRTPRLDRRGPE